MEYQTLEKYRISTYPFPVTTGLSEIVREAYEKISVTKDEEKPYSQRFVEAMSEMISTDPRAKRLFPDPSVFY